MFQKVSPWFEKNDNGMAVVLSKRAQDKGLNLSSLRNDDGFGEDWFFHPDGGLASFGGRKAPKDPKNSQLLSLISPVGPKRFLLGEVMVPKV